MAAPRGSHKSGTPHWWAQRVTALALVPLTIWFVGSIAFLSGADYETMRAWIANPVVAGLLILMIIATFYHLFLGVEVVLEDYVHHEGIRLASTIMTKGAALLFGAIALVSVLKILFGG